MPKADSHFNFETWNLTYCWQFFEIPTTAGYPSALVVIATGTQAYRRSRPAYTETPCSLPFTQLPPT